MADLAVIDRHTEYIRSIAQTVVDRHGEWPSSVAFFKRRGLLRKLVFGTDWPIHNQMATMAASRERLAGGEGSALTHMELRWVMEVNAREVLQIEAPPRSPPNPTP